jgi:hypothetical protein
VQDKNAPGNVVLVKAFGKVHLKDFIRRRQQRTMWIRGELGVIGRFPSSNYVV